MNENPYGAGAHESPFDIRDFAYIPTGVPASGGYEYTPDDINHQHKVGICTADSTVMNASKALGMKMSAEFQYLMQKLQDGNWDEGSSLRSAMQVGKNIGFLPIQYWTFTTEEDRMLPYQQYIAKLQAVTQSQIDSLKTFAAPYKLKAYASVPVDHDSLAQAILESKAGILTRYSIGSEWWTAPIEPLRAPQVPVSGHAAIDEKYTGNSFRIANGWGKDWATNGTAYRIHSDYKPTEAWLPYYNDVPGHVQVQLDNRTTVIGKTQDIVQTTATQLRIIAILQAIIKLFTNK